MKYYHPKSSKLLPYERRLAIDLIKGYDDMVAHLNNMIQMGIIMDGQPHSSTPGDPVGMAVIRRAEKSKPIDAINNALLTIPPEYRDIVFRWVRTGKALNKIGGDYAHRNTYSRYKEQLLYEVAKTMGWHEDWHQC